MKVTLTLLSSALLAAGALPFAAVPAAAQAPIRYEIDFENRVHHEARITLRMADLGPGPVELRMSRTSPGRYALHEFAKNVYAVRITDGAGRPLEVTRPDPHQWTVAGHDGALVVEYTLFGDRADGTYTGIDETHAHLNIPATFMYARGLGERPIEVRFGLPEYGAWNVATQLVPTADPEVFTAPDFDYFMDSPTELSAFELREWSVPGPDGPQTMRAAIHSQDDNLAVGNWAAAVRRIAAEQAAVFGTYPRFDFGTYTFLACYLPYVAGDGMEHRNSTSLTSTASLTRNLNGALGTAAHELFHAWNMERIRGADLEPFDFEEAVMSRELWFGEGFTNYYGQLTMARAGVNSAEAFARRVGTVVDVVTNSPGRERFSPIEMSMQAPFVDAAVSVDPTNRVNTFISYYTYGEFLGLALDLTLRARSGGRTLDDFMRLVWERHGQPEVPYTVDDLQAALGELTGDRAFAADFFDRFVRGSELPDMAALLARAGISLHRANPGMPFLTSSRLRPVAGGYLVDTPALVNEPMHDAGIERGDLITRVNGVALDTIGALERALEGTSAGDSVQVDWTSWSGLHRTAARLIEHPALAATPDEILAGGTYTAEERAFRERWLSSRAAETNR